MSYFYDNIDENNVPQVSIESIEKNLLSMSNHKENFCKKNGMQGGAPTPPYKVSELYTKSLMRDNIKRIKYIQRNDGGINSPRVRHDIWKDAADEIGDGCTFDGGRITYELYSYSVDQGVCPNIPYVTYVTCKQFVVYSLSSIKLAKDGVKEDVKATVGECLGNMEKYLNFICDTPARSDPPAPEDKVKANLSMFNNFVERKDNSILDHPPKFPVMNPSSKNSSVKKEKEITGGGDEGYESKPVGGDEGYESIPVNEKIKLWIESFFMNYLVYGRKIRQITPLLSASFKTISKLVNKYKQEFIELMFIRFDKDTGPFTSANFNDHELKTIDLACQRDTSYVNNNNLLIVPADTVFLLRTTYYSIMLKVISGINVEKSNVVLNSDVENCFADIVKLVNSVEFSDFITNFSSDHTIVVDSPVSVYLNIPTDKTHSNRYKIGVNKTYEFLSIQYNPSITIDTPVYPYSYKMGPFKKIFKSNDNLSYMLNDSDKKAWFLMGYGALGMLILLLKELGNTYDFMLCVDQFYVDSTGADIAMTQTRQIDNEKFTLDIDNELQSAKNIEIKDFSGKPVSLKKLSIILTTVINDPKYRRRSHVLVTILLKNKSNPVNAENDKTLYFADYAGVENTLVCDSYDELFKLANMSSNRPGTKFLRKSSRDDLVMPCDDTNDRSFALLPDDVKLLHPSSKDYEMVNQYIKEVDIVHQAKYFGRNNMPQTYKIMGLDMDKSITEIMKPSISIAYNHVIQCMVDILESHENVRKGRHIKPTSITRLQSRIDNNKDNHWNYVKEIFSGSEVIINVFDVQFEIIADRLVVKKINFNDSTDSATIMKDIVISHINYISSSLITLRTVYMSCNCRNREGVFNRTIGTARDALNDIVKLKIQDRLFSVHGNCFSDAHIYRQPIQSTNKNSNIIHKYILEGRNINDVEFILLGVFDNSEDKNETMPQAYIDVKDLILEHKRYTLYEYLNKNKAYRDAVIKYIKYAEMEQSNLPDKELELFTDYIKKLNNKPASDYEISKVDSMIEVLKKYVEWVKYYKSNGNKGITKDQSSLIIKLVNSFITSPDLPGLLAIIKNQLLLNENTPLGALSYLDSVAKYKYGYSQGYDEVQPVCGLSYNYSTDV
jgi:hypothetical protein